MCHTDKHVESELSRRIRRKTCLINGAWALVTFFDDADYLSKTQRLLFAEHKQRWPDVVGAHF